VSYRIVSYSLITKMVNGDQCASEVKVIYLAPCVLFGVILIASLNEAIS